MRVATLTCDKFSGEARDVKLSSEFMNESPLFRLDVLSDFRGEFERLYWNAYRDFQKEGNQIRAEARRKRIEAEK